jgi:hypothetical protein
VREDEEGGKAKTIHQEIEEEQKLCRKQESLEKIQFLIGT